jgi:hypothetical protein
VTLWIGGRIRGGYLAWCTEVDGTFVVAPDVRTTLETPLLDRSPFHINPDQQARLEIMTADGRKFLFERDAQILRARGGEASDDIVEPLATALRNITVVSAAGTHPEARRIQRGSPLLSIHARTAPDTQGVEKTLTLHFGAPTIWLGIPAHIAWILGESENYFVSRQSFLELSALL